MRLRTTSSTSADEFTFPGRPSCCSTSLLTGCPTSAYRGTGARFDPGELVFDHGPAGDRDLWKKDGGAKTPLDSSKLAHQIANIALTKKAEDIQLLDLREAPLGTDYFLICSGNSGTHVKAVVDEILEQLKAEGQRVWRVEGYASGRWVLLDFVDVVVHAFHRETRSYFGLELLWGDVPCERVED